MKIKILLSLFLTIQFCAAQTHFPDTFGFTVVGIRPNPDTVKIKTEEIKKIFSSGVFTITAWSEGCFHSIREVYVFTKADSLYDVTYSYKANWENIEINRQSVKITKAKFGRILQLCLRGPGLLEGFCTTTVTFTIQNKTSTVQFFDGRCSSEDDISRALKNLVGIKEFR